MPETDHYIARTSEFTDADGALVRHPYNPNSEVRIIPLAERTGLTRLGLAIGRIPPGKESFVLHAHMRDEEFLYILSGEGALQIGEDRHTVGPGDFAGFPIDGTPHQLFNTGAQDLVYLMGGERSGFDVAVFPGLQKIGISSNTDQTMTFYDANAAETRPYSDWFTQGETR